MEDTEIEKLLTDRDWVRRVARNLVDPAAADDVAQEAWLRVSVRGRRPRSLRAFLATTLRNLARDRRRAEGRRADHEAVAARRRPEADADPMLARAEAHRDAVQAVLALPEPYRATVLLRYFEELSIPEVAARQGVPVETVRTRLRRAHARLKKALGAAVLLLAGLPAGRATAATAGALTTGALVMSAKSKLLVAAALLLTVGVGVVVLFLPAPGEPPPAPVASGAADGVAPGPRPPSADDPDAVPPARSGRAGFVVRVTDGTGRPLSGARIQLGPPWKILATRRDLPRSFLLAEADAVRTLATTDAEGRAEARGVPVESFDVRITAPGRGTAIGTVHALAGATDASEFALGPAHSIEGRLTFTDGAPAAGAELVVRGDPPRELAVERATTDEDGNFRLSNLPSGTWRLRAFPSPDVDRALGAVELPGPGRLDLRIDRGGSLSGRVVDAETGEGVARAWIGVSLQANARRAEVHRVRARTGPDGRWRVEGVPPGTPTMILVTAPGYAEWPGPGGGAIPEPVGVLSPGSEARIDAALRRAAVVRGRVTGPDGEPVEDAEVYVQAVLATPAVRTDADGRYELPNVPFGRSILSVRADGYAMPGLPLEPLATRVTDAIAVDVPGPGDVVRDVRLVRASVISGTVRHADGRPAEGVSVLLAENGGIARGEAFAVTDAEGRYSFSSPSSAREQRICARGPGGSVGWSAPLTAAPGEPVEWADVELDPGATFGGTVVDAAGRPVPGAELRLLDDLPDPGRSAHLRFVLARSRRVAVGPDGRFRAEGMRAGSILVYARAEGCGPLLRDLGRIAAGEVRDGETIRLPEDAVVAGRVVGPAGEAIAGARVAVELGTAGWARPDVIAHAVTDADGHFEKRGLFAGTQRVWVEADGYVPGDYEVRTGTGEKVFRLDRARSIEGRVVAADSGMPVAGAIVETDVPLTTGVGSRNRFRTGSDGSFRFDGVPEGAYELRVVAPGDFIDTTVADLPAGARDVVVRLPAGRRITGAVLRPDGSPADAVRIEVSPEPRFGGSRILRSETNGDGRFSTPPLAAGRYRVHPDPYSLRRFDVLVPEDRTVDAGADVVFRLDPAESIEGRVVAPAGVVIPKHATVRWRARAGDTRVRNSPIADDGTFRISPLPPGGIFDLVVSGVPETLGGRVLGVRAGTRGVGIRLETGGGTILGRVVDRDGSPVPAGVSVTARAEGVEFGDLGISARTETERDGTFRLEGLGDHGFRIEVGGLGSPVSAYRSPEEVRPGTSGLELTVRRLYRISGTIVDREGVLLPVREMEFQEIGGGEPWGCRISGGELARGRFESESIGARRVRISVRVGDRWLDAGTAELPAEDVRLVVDRP